MKKSGFRTACGLLIVVLLFYSAVSNSASGTEAEKGKQLFQTLNCASCHSLEGKGGCLAPSLDNAFERRSAAYIRLRLNKDDESAFIKLIGHPELMPHPRFSKAEVAALTDYLATVKKPASANKLEDNPHKDLMKEKDTGRVLSSPSTASGIEIEKGKELFYKSACLSCHTVYDMGGDLGPALDGIGMRRSRQSIDKFIGLPSSKMPNFKLSSAERKQIVEFLLTLPPSPRG